MRNKKIDLTYSGKLFSLLMGLILSAPLTAPAGPVSGAEGRAMFEDY